MTPKSLLRHKEAVSPLKELANGRFQTVLGDTVADPSKVRRVVFCSGKVYYDLLAERERREGRVQDGGVRTALVRLEQLYPLDAASLPRPWLPSSRPRSPGSRTSPPTRAPGPSWRSTCLTP